MAGLRKIPLSWRQTMKTRSGLVGGSQGAADQAETSGMT
jgi:hypothetical protein